jgi:excisionase family DNA binding protein
MKICLHESGFFDICYHYYSASNSIVSMKLTLDQAAVKLGKTARQIRYLIQQGRLPADKLGGRWLIDSDVLPLDETGRQRRSRRTDRLRDAVEEVLGDGQERARYSLRDLKAFQIAVPMFQELRHRLGDDHLATRHLRSTLDHLAQGCHRFGREEKSSAYRGARDAVSLAICELLLGDEPLLHESVDILEQEFMPAVAGLLRRAERRERA